MALRMSWYAEPSAVEKTKALISPGPKLEVREVAFLVDFRALHTVLLEHFPTPVQREEYAPMYMTPAIINQIERWAFSYRLFDARERVQRNELINSVLPNIRRAMEQGKPVFYYPA